MCTTIVRIVDKEIQVTSDLYPVTSPSFRLFSGHLYNIFVCSFKFLVSHSLEISFFFRHDGEVIDVSHRILFPD